MLEIPKKKFAAINKSFLQLKDIEVLMDCSSSKASFYRKKFLKQYDVEHDYFAQMVPTTEFLKYFKIDIERIRQNYITSQEIIMKERLYAAAEL